MQHLDATPTVATVIDPAERSGLDAAAQGRFAAVHARSIDELLRTVRERPVHAVLVSPRCVRPDQLPRLASLVRGFPEVPTLAVVSHHDAAASARLLELGASGVRRMVDLSGRDGWHSLRELLIEPASPTAATVLAGVLPAMGEEATPGCRRFQETVVRMAPRLPTVRRLARRLDVLPSTFMSRFFRVGLPSPKRYLAAMRLVHAAALFQVPSLSISDVAYRLEYSSPQSFGRHVRALLGVTAGEFRRRFPFAVTLDDYITRLVVPFRAVFSTFHPLEPGVADLGHRW
jgi:AraC-like DNA-binding protein